MNRLPRANSLAYPRSDMRKWLIISGLLLGALGCDSTLETGYKPNVLSSTDARGRAYYAPPFSPEAKAAQEESSVQVRPQSTRY